MGHTVNSILINAPYELVFNVSNDIERWTELFGEEYVKSDVLKRTESRIDFELENKEGARWRSFRLLHKEEMFALAKRVDPMFPFQYMDIIWLYREVEGGILMTWIQDFDMDKQATVTSEKVESLINEHSQANIEN